MLCLEDFVETLRKKNTQASVLTTTISSICTSTKTEKNCIRTDMIVIGNGSYMSHNDQIYPNVGGVRGNGRVYNGGYGNSELLDGAHNDGFHHYDSDEYASDENEDEDEDENEYTGKEDNIFKWTLDALLGTRFQKGKKDKVDNLKNENYAGTKIQAGNNLPFGNINENESKLSNFSENLFQTQNDDMRAKFGLDGGLKDTDEITNTFNLKGDYNTNTLNFKPLRSARKDDMAPAYTNFGVKAGENLKSSKDLFSEHYYPDGENFNQHNKPNANAIPGGFGDPTSLKKTTNHSRQLRDETPPRINTYKQKDNSQKPSFINKPGKNQENIMAELENNNAKLSKILETREAQEQQEMMQEQSYKKKYTHLKKNYKSLLTSYRDLSEVAIQEIQNLKMENDMLRQQLNR